MEVKKFFLFYLIFFFGFLPSESDTKETIKKALLFLEMQEFETSIEAYKKALLKFPHQPDIRKCLAYAYFRLGKTEEALKYLKEELSLFPTNGDAYDLSIYILLKLNRVQEAVKISEKYYSKVAKASQTTSNSGIGDFLLGIHFKYLGDYTTAKKYFIQARSRGFNSLKCNIQLEDLGSKEKSNLSREIFYRPTSSCSKKVQTIFEEGISLYIKSKNNVMIIRDAIKKFHEAVFFKPDFKEALFNLAAIYYNLGEYSKASEYLEKIVKFEPENERIKSYFYCIDSLKYVEKKQILDKCPKYIPLIKELVTDLEYKYQYTHDIAFLLNQINNIALDYIKNGQLPEGIKRFQNALEIYEESPEINYNLGIIHFSVGNLNEAEKHAIIATKSIYFKPKIKKEFKWAFKLENKREPFPEISVENWNFELALKQGNSFLEAYDLLGNVYFKKGEFEKSVLAFKKVLEIDPSDALGHYNLGCAYFALKEYEKAEESWKEAIKHDRRKKEKGEEAVEESSQMPRVSVTVLKRTVSFHSYKSLGSLYQERGELKKAIESYQKAIEIFPTDADCYYELGKLYIQIGEKENAIKNLEKYLEYGTEKEKEVRELLQKLKEK